MTSLISYQVEQIIVSVKQDYFQQSPQGANIFIKKFVKSCFNFFFFVHNHYECD